MKKKLLSSVLIILLTLSTTLQAEMSFAQKVSYDMVKGIVSAIAGKEIGKLFGDSAITKEQLDKSLDEHFEKFSYELYQEEVRYLKEKIYDFSPSSTTLKASGVDGVLDAVEKLASKIDSVMHEHTFWEVMPTYIYLSNIRLAFLAQKHALDPNGGWDETMAENAVRSMVHVRKYWILYMTRPEGNLSCINKEINQKYITYSFGSGGIPNENIVLNPMNSNIKRIIPNTETELCKFDIMFKKLEKYIRAEKGPQQFLDGQVATSAYADNIKKNLPTDAFFNAKNVFNTFQHKDKWWFTYKRPNTNGQHWISGPYSSETDAREQRFRFTYFSYDDELGPLKHTIMQWHDIAYRFGSNDTKRDATQISALY